MHRMQNGNNRFIVMKKISRQRRISAARSIPTHFPRWLLFGCFLCANALTSPLNQYKPSRRRSTVRRFVLTTPESIIEQASTTKLLDELIDESVRTSARRPIMMQFDPSSGWIWKRWKGTVFSETWDACLYRMAYASAAFFMCKSFPQVKETLSGFSILWGQLLSVTTFTLTFFVNQSYALWKKCSDLSRSLQGRLHDMDMTLATHATRISPSGPNEPSRYTPESRQMLELVSRYVRLFNLLTYASFTRSHRPVLTPRGMRRLVERGLMTSLEREVLINPTIPATQRHNAVLLWIIRAFIEGTEAGHFLGGDGFEQQFIEKAHVCRSAYGSIGDELQGRMPLAYAHIVQVLVDLVLVLYPFMAYSAGMSGFVCVLGTGILTIGYQGLFDLAKQFLDPYDNENYGKGEDPLVVDTLIAETNAGSVRWMHGLAEMPLSPIKVREGDLSEYLLPLRGFSVDELKYKQEEKQLLQEKREKEELERLRREEQEQLVRSAADKMVPALFNANGNMMKSQLATSKIVFHNTGDRLRIPGLLRESSFQTAEMVTEAMYSQNSNATSLQVALIPKGTSPALSYMKAPTKLVIPTRESDMLQEETIPPYNSDMCDISVAVDVDCVEEGHICVDEPVTVFDCKNSAVSQDVTDDAALELETKPDPGDIDDANENQYPKLISEIVDSLDIDTSFTLEDYERQVKETLQAEKAELLETQAILNAPPAAEAIDVLQRGMDPKMNTTGTISDAGSDLVPSAEIVRNSTETSEIIVEDLFPESLSLIPDLDIIPSDRPAIVTVADLEKQVQEILEAEKAEMLETQAILNAPPAADGIEVLEEENKDSLLRSLNATNSESDLAILEMDAPDVPPDHSLSIYDESSVDNSDVGDYKIEVGVMCGANMGASEENDINWSINSVNGEKSVDGDGE